MMMLSRMKSLDDLLDSLRGERRLLLLGCNGCEESFGNTEPERLRRLGAVRREFLPPLFQFVSRHENVHLYPGGVCPGCRPRIPTVPLPRDPVKKYAVIIGREPIAIRADLEADEFWLVGNCAVKAGMAYLLRRAFSGGFTSIPRVVKVPGCPPLDWYSQRVIFPPLRAKGWMSN
jgi:hypothetical protein